IAAWIGALAYRLHKRGAAWYALGLCLASALVGWLLRPDLDLLDTEHAVALPIGFAAAVWVPRLRLSELREPVARRAFLLHGSLLRHGAPRPELLRPERRVAVPEERPAGEVADAELVEARGQDVLAVTRRVEPGTHDLTRRAERAGAPGDVL